MSFTERFGDVRFLYLLLLVDLGLARTAPRQFLAAGVDDVNHHGAGFVLGHGRVAGRQTYAPTPPTR